MLIALACLGITVACLIGVIRLARSTREIEKRTAERRRKHEEWMRRDFEERRRRSW